MASFLLLAGILCTQDGCGYHFRGGEQDRLSGGIHVAIFGNRTYRPGLETVVTAMLINEMARHNGGNLVQEPIARYLLEGAIISYSSSPISYTASDRIAEYRATLTVLATLYEKSSRKALWKGTVTVSQDYPSYIINGNSTLLSNQPRDFSLQQNSEDAAIREIGRRLAENIYQKMQEDF